MADFRRTPEQRRFQEHDSGWLEPSHGGGQLLVLHRRNHGTESELLLSPLAERFAITVRDRRRVQVEVNETDAAAARLSVIVALDEINQEWPLHLGLPQIVS